MSLMGREEVFEAKIACLGAASSNDLNSASFTSKFSTMASMTKSAFSTACLALVESWMRERMVAMNASA